MSFSPASRIPERKCRRTHKNSKDGCPNCKAKRIKCSEELPSCLNCVKKKYRCGYLDFSKERLDHIRKKNEMKVAKSPIVKNDANENYRIKREKDFAKVKENTFETVYVDSRPLSNVQEGQLMNAQQFQSNDLRPIGSIALNPRKGSLHYSDAGLDVTSLSGSSSSVTVSNNSPSVSENSRDIFAMVSPITSNIIGQEFFTTRDDLRMATYKDSFFKLSHYDCSYPQTPSGPKNSQFLESLSNNSDNEKDHELSSNGSFENAEFRFDRHLRANVNKDQSDHFNRNSATINGNLHQFVEHGDSQVSSGALQADNVQKSKTLESKVDNRHSFQENSRINPLPELTHVNIINPYSPPNYAKIGNCLMNATIKPVIFEKLARTERLKNSFLSNFLQNVGKEFKSFTNTDYSIPYSPVWKFQNSDLFWRSVYNQSVLIDLYFNFFMDRSINVLMRKCIQILAVEELRRNKERHPLDSPHSTSVWTSFTRNDLDILTKKSYASYGSLIRCLRESMTQIHIEFPTKISLFSSWSTLMQLHSSIDTLCLMLNGTASLINKIVHEATSFDQITPTLIIMANCFNDHTITAVIPDYKFDVIRELQDDLKKYKQFLIKNQDLASTTNELLLRDFLNLEMFLQQLTNEVYPLIQNINKYFKSANSIDDQSDNIYYTSPTLFFNMLVSWLNIIPSECLTVSSRMSPVKKVLYLFFIAVGKALPNVFTPLRSILITDPLAIMYPRVDFDCETYNITLKNLNSDHEQFHYFKSLSNKLLRIVKFFTYRNELLSHYFSSRSILKDPKEESYLMMADNIPKSRFPYSDIIRIIPKKVDVGEVMITNFGNTDSIGIENYPLMKKLPNDTNLESRTTLYNLIHNEAINQEFRINSGQVTSNDFIYSSGLFQADYDIRVPLEFYTNTKQPGYSIPNFDLDEIRTRMGNFSNARLEVEKAVKLSK